MNRKYILGAILILALIGALAYYYGGSQAPAGQPPLRDLTSGNLAQFKDTFNTAKDDVRMLLLLSPS